MCERFVGLVRVSTERQGNSRLGLEAGLADLHAYIAQQGAELITIVEEVESGCHDDIIDRPTLRKALTLCKRHKACLLVPKVDRLVRSTQVHTDIKRSGVKVRFAEDPHATEEIIDMKVAMAAFEGRQISNRVRKALAVYKAEGRVSKRTKAMYPNGVPAEVANALGGKLGAALVGSHLTDADRAKGRAKGNAKQSRVAVEMYEDLAPDMLAWRADGLSQQAIADKLNARGDRTRTGAEWSQVQVMRTLKRIEGMVS